MAGMVVVVATAVAAMVAVDRVVPAAITAPEPCA